MAPKAIAEVLEEEHPQIAATVMTQLYDEQAAKVLELLSDDMRKDIILRIARMEELDPRARGSNSSMRAIRKMMSLRISSESNSSTFAACSS